METRVVGFDSEVDGFVWVYTVRASDYHEDMDEYEAETSSMEIGTYPYQVVSVSEWLRMVSDDIERV